MSPAQCASGSCRHYCCKIQNPDPRLDYIHWEGCIKCDSNGDCAACKDEHYLDPESKRCHRLKAEGAACPGDYVCNNNNKCSGGLCCNSDVTCSGNGECADGTVTCACDPGYTGAACDVCNGAPDPDVCNRDYEKYQCQDPINGDAIRATCRVMCNTCEPLATPSALKCGDEPDRDICEDFKDMCFNETELGDLTRQACPILCGLCDSSGPSTGTLAPGTSAAPGLQPTASNPENGSTTATSTPEQGTECLPDRYFCSKRGFTQSKCTDTGVGALVRSQCQSLCGICVSKLKVDGHIPGNDGAQCVADKGCSSQVCRAGRCCGPAGRSEGCTGCDDAGDCAEGQCAAGYVWEDTRQCLPDVLYTSDEHHEEKVPWWEWLAFAIEVLTVSGIIGLIWAKLYQAHKGIHRFPWTWPPFRLTFLCSACAFLVLLLWTVLIVWSTGEWGNPHKWIAVFSAGAIVVTFAAHAPEALHKFGYCHCLFPPASAHERLSEDVYARTASLDGHENFTAGELFLNPLREDEDLARESSRASDGDAPQGAPTCRHSGDLGKRLVHTDQIHVKESGMSGLGECAEA